MFQYAIYLLIIVVGWLPMRGFAHAAEPYDLRGIRLGISISEFRKLPHQDGLPAKVVCTGDKEAKRLYELSVYGEDESAAGVIACNYFEYRKSFKDSPLPAQWEEAHLNVATVGVYMNYKFIPDPKLNGEHALYAIVVRSNVAYWSKFWEGYVGRYGKPTRLSTTPIQNRAGASFDNVEAVWDNGLSSITLIKRFSRVDNTHIIYEHKRLFNEIRDRVRKKKGSPADKL